jgi:L-alanine-DL-glutamate epimerase-like enolase superfamily enzyme
MKVVGIETIRLEEYPAILFLQIHTDEGIVGLGENCVGVEAVEAFIHESIAPRLIGKDPLAITSIHETLHQDFIGFAGSGVAVRGASSLDIALWDILGQATGQPIYQLMGGKVRHSIRAYNTCAGSAYAKGSSNIDRNRKAQIGIPTGNEFEDLIAFLNEPEALVASLKQMGMTAMKIWPFDEAAMRSGGQTIDKKDLDEGRRIIERARNAAGNDFDIMLEMHSLWSAPAASIIAKSVEEFDLFWIEDALRHESTEALIRFKQSTNIPVTVGETTGTRWDYLRLLSSRAVDHLMFDPGWAGGITEARHVLGLASTYGVPVAPHDCTGPVVLTVGTHLAVSYPGIELQEMVRAFYYGWYAEMLTDLPIYENGYLRPQDKPGLGTSLRPEITKRKDAKIRWSKVG